MQPMPADFFQKPTIELAKALLGCFLVKETDGGTASGYIVETEAYLGAEDRAAHSFSNRRTKRTEIMFGEAGSVYTHQMHTHTLVNVVSGPIGTPHSVLIRAVEPYTGLDLMHQRRGIENIKNLTNGPGKLTKALGITMEDYGHSFLKPPLFIAPGRTPTDISVGPRVGIENTGEARDYPLRFYITSNPYVSRMRKTNKTKNKASRK